MLLYYGITQKEFASIIGVSPSLISQYIKGQTQKSGVIIEGIATNFPSINMNWVLRGEGAMIKNTESSVAEPDVRYSRQKEQNLIDALVQKVKELDAIVQELQKKSEL